MDWREPRDGGIKSLNETVWNFGFKEIEEDNNFKQSKKNGKCDFHILNEDNILLSSGGVNVLLQIKNSCPQVLISVMSFSFYELRLIEIKERGIIVTTKAYSEKILKQWSMQMSKSTPVPIVKGNSFGNLSVRRTNVK